MFDSNLRERNKGFHTFVMFAAASSSILFTYACFNPTLTIDSKMLKPHTKENKINSQKTQIINHQKTQITDLFKTDYSGFSASQDLSQVYAPLIKFSNKQYPLMLDLNNFFQYKFIEK